MFENEEGRLIWKVDKLLFFYNLWMYVEIVTQSFKFTCDSACVPESPSWNKHGHSF